LIRNLLIKRYLSIIESVYALIISAIIIFNTLKVNSNSFVIDISTSIVIDISASIFI